MLVTLCQTSLLTTAPWQSTSIFVIVVGVFKFPLCILPDPLCNCRLRKKIKNSFESCFFCCHIKRKKKEKLPMVSEYPANLSHQKENISVLASEFPVFFRRLNRYFPVYFNNQRFDFNGCQKEENVIYLLKYNQNPFQLNLLNVFFFLFLSLLKFYRFPYFVKVLKTGILKYIQKYKNMCQRWRARMGKRKITFHKVVD